MVKLIKKNWIKNESQAIFQATIFFLLNWVPAALAFGAVPSPFLSLFLERSRRRIGIGQDHLLLIFMHFPLLNVFLLLGGDSIEKFQLEKSSEFWLKKSSEVGRLDMYQNQNGISSATCFSSQKPTFFYWNGSLLAGFFTLLPLLLFPFLVLWLLRLLAALLFDLHDISAAFVCDAVLLLRGLYLFTLTFVCDANLGRLCSFALILSFTCTIWI